MYLKQLNLLHNGWKIELSKRRRSAIAECYLDQFRQYMDYFGPTAVQTMKGFAQQMMRKHGMSDALLAKYGVTAQEIFDEIHIEKVQIPDENLGAQFFAALTEQCESAMSKLSMKTQKRTRASNQSIMDIDIEQSDTDPIPTNPTQLGVDLTHTDEDSDHHWFPIPTKKKSVIPPTPTTETFQEMFSTNSNTNTSTVQVFIFNYLS